jgi:DNA/RNA endonuclease YhcR with UshA esterase domain
MRYSVILAAVLAPGLLLAQADADPLTPEEAAKKVDEKVTMQMEVKSTGRGNTTRYLNSMTNFRDRSNFTIVIFSSDLPRFRKVEIDDPTEYYKGKTIQVTGTVSVYRGQVQIQVDDPEQIKVVEKDTEQPKAKTAKGKGGKPK